MKPRQPLEECKMLNARCKMVYIFAFSILGFALFQSGANSGSSKLADERSECRFTGNGSAANRIRWDFLLSAL